MSKEEKEENIENNPEEGEEPVAQPKKEFEKKNGNTKIKNN